MWNLLCIRAGVLYRRWENFNGKEIKFLLVVPKSLKNFILSQLHDSTTGAHLGVSKTHLKFRERFFWYALKKDVREWCTSCEVCGSRKVTQKKGKAPMKQYNVGLPMERIAIDFMGPLPRSNSENGNVPKRYLMVIGDYFTKWTEAIPLENLEAKTVARVLIDNFICRFGVPLFLHTDQGASFESQLFQEICQILGNKKTRTTKARPQTDGMIERANRTILNMLSAFVSEHQRDWVEYIPLVMMAYQSSVHESTCTTPSMMTSGREIRLPIDLILGHPEREDSEQAYGSQYASQLSEKINEVHEFARSRLQIASNAMKRNYDIQPNLFEFNVGNPVWFFDPTREVGLNPKLQRPRKGPFKVISKISEILYRIQQSPRHKPRVVHHDRLRKYKSRILPAWFSSPKDCLKKKKKTIYSKGYSNYDLPCNIFMGWSLKVMSFFQIINYGCGICHGKLSFKTRSATQTHLKEQHSGISFKCEKCHKIYRRNNKPHQCRAKENEFYLFSTITGACREEAALELKVFEDRAYNSLIYVKAPEDNFSVPDAPLPLAPARKRTQPHPLIMEKDKGICPRHPLPLPPPPPHPPLLTPLLENTPQRDGWGDREINRASASCKQLNISSVKCG